MARQPILDRKGGLYAYELLYRRSTDESSGILDIGEERQAVLNATVELGLERLCGDLPAFFNLSPEMLGDESTRLLPPDRVVLEILETAVLNEPTKERLTSLRGRGYRLAYDDFTFERHQLPFVGMVDIVKIDVLAAPWPLVAAGIGPLKARGTLLLAEKVEDRETHERCLRAGFDLFQGYYFSRPETLAARNVGPRERAVLRLIAVLNDPNPTVERIAVAVALDAGLGIRILNLANSAAFVGAGAVESVHRAVQVLGTRRLQAFATVMAAGSVTGKDNRALSELGLVRARVCESLARENGGRDPHTAFTIGLLSVLDALMNLPMSRIVENLDLPREVESALLTPESCRELRAAQAMERAAWPEIDLLHIDDEGLSTIYVRAIEEASSLI